MKVRVDKGQLDYFRLQARSTNLEIMAYLVGEVNSAELVTIERFAYTKQYAIQTNVQVGWTGEEWVRIQKQAEESGKRIVGHIHSHPEWDAVMSPADYEGCIIEGYRTCGIVSVHGRKTRVRFWTTDSALPCEIEYVEKAKSTAIPAAVPVPGSHHAEPPGDA